MSDVTKQNTALLVGFFALALTASTASAGSLKGEVAVTGKKKLKSIVVYLEGAGEGRKDHAPVTIRQRDRVFKPKFSVLVKGAKVKFANDELQDIDHNVYSLSKTNKFDVGLLAKGNTHDVLFDKLGPVKYYCSVHKNMEGALVVVPTPHFVHLATPGPFTIENVPAGDWVAKAVVSHRRYAASPVKVTIADGQDASITIAVGRKKRRKK